MKKKLLFWIAFSLIPIGYIGMSHFSGGAYSTLGLPIGGERAHLRDVTLSFTEDIQFKDFKKAATYHEPSVQDQVDIPYLLERLFMIKPEALDIMSYEIVFAELDSSKLRGRVKIRLKIKDLVSSRIRDQEIIYFYHRESLSAPWYMVLESSLRQLKGDAEKSY